MEIAFLHYQTIILWKIEPTFQYFPEFSRFASNTNFQYMHSQPSLFELTSPPQTTLRTNFMTSGERFSSYTSEGGQIAEM